LYTANNTRAHLRKETFVFVWKHFKEVVGHYSAENSVAEIFEPFVTDPVTVIQLNGLRFMTEGQFIQKNISGIIPENIF
jgi:hypothetical protein